MAGAASDDSPAFNAVNRGKRGIVLDLKRAPARDALPRLAATADIFIENGRPGALARLGLDYATLAPDVRAWSTRRSPATARPVRRPRRAASI